MKSELDIEKWKNTGLRQIREEMNASELARVSVMRKICSTADKYEKEISELKLQVRNQEFKLNPQIDKKNLIEKEYTNQRLVFELREREYLETMNKLKEERNSQQQEFSRVKAETSLMYLELESYQNIIKHERSKKILNEDLELAEKIELLHHSLRQKNSELEDVKHNRKEAFEQIHSFQAHNTELRAYIQSLEEKAEGVLTNSYLDIQSLVNNHMEMLSISAEVVKITENIYKIDNESLHLFIKNGELMTQQNSKELTFVEWLQKNKWKSVPGEDTEFLCEKSKKLDTVPEEDEDDEPISLTPAKNQKRIARQSPPIKPKKDFSPVLRKSHK